jgi:hypothetical protein
MMKHYTCMILLALLIGGTLPAQTAKGLKALEASDYKGAKAAFESALASDASDAGAHLGLSRYYGIQASGERDLEKAIASLASAEQLYNAADEKGKAKYEKSGVSATTLAERRSKVESAFLEQAKDVHTIAAYDAFLARFPASTVARPATNYRNELAFKAAETENTEASWNYFIKTYPEAEVLPQAIVNRNKVASEAALKANTVEAYAAFVRNYPDALQAPQMQQRLNSVAFDAAKAQNTAAGYEAYLRDYPDSIFAAQAKQRLEALRAGAAE